MPRPRQATLPDAGAEARGAVEAEPPQEGGRRRVPSEVPAQTGRSPDGVQGRFRTRRELISARFRSPRTSVRKRARPLAARRNERIAAGSGDLAVRAS